MSVQLSPLPGLSRPAALRCSCAKTASSSSPRSPRGRICCPRWASRPPAFRQWSRRGELGSATVVAAAMVATLLSITGGGVYLGAAVVARHRAQAAADLAALGAAARLAAGPEPACAQAQAIAREMRVSTASCTVDDLDVVVTIEVPLAVGRWGTAQAAARAGPG
ncbi:MAG: flp pilus-assembly TadE/G-like family protein [Mycobacterium sp.]|nr:flp pilus-assembly TadE/G-like family protein [Mycobacterium sp.]